MGRLIYGMKVLVGTLWMGAILLVMPVESFAVGSCSSGIKGNGTGGISIDINAAPYNTIFLANQGGYEKYAYTNEGCAWFASARVRQLTGKGSVIYSGYAWYYNVYSSLGFTRGNSPCAKALACYSNHVAVVEAVNGDTITVSQGGMSGLSDAAHGYCVISTMTRAKLESQGGCGTFYGYVYLNGESGQTHDPEGCFDVATGGVGNVFVYGWAFDRDVLGHALQIHVYVGGPAGSGAPGYAITADTSRPDVNSAYPGVGDNHGFSSTIAVSSTGQQDIYVYAINAGGGDTNPLLGKKTVTIEKDNEKPKISNVSITTDGSGYKVICTVTDNDAVDRVQFPTWTLKGDQDDIDRSWQTSEQSRGTISGNQVTFVVRRCDHNNEFGTYRTHIYAYDKAGNVSAVSAGDYSFDLSDESQWNITLSQSNYEYDGKEKRPSIRVEHGTIVLTEGISYSVSFSNNIDAGTATVTVSGKHNYTGIVKKKFSIKKGNGKVEIGSVSISGLKAKKKGFRVTWKKNLFVSGYQIQYSRKSNFKNQKSVYVRNNRITSKTIERLSSKKKYYVRMRTYKIVNGVRKYSGWSSKKSITTI